MSERTTEELIDRLCKDYDDDSSLNTYVLSVLSDRLQQQADEIKMLREELIKLISVVSDDTDTITELKAENERLIETACHQSDEIKRLKEHLKNKAYDCQSWKESEHACDVEYNKQVDEISQLKAVLTHAGWTKKDGALAWKPPVNTKVRDLRSEITELKAENIQLQAKLKIATDALKDVKSYEEDSTYGEGLCNWGCDTPFIATEALAKIEANE
jgi:predicted HicB family RNase H-like nuclease